ncbi:hypothetical protein ACQJBY_040521 [Aegilops geniculata]
MDPSYVWLCAACRHREASQSVSFVSLFKDEYKLPKGSVIELSLESNHILKISSYGPRDVGAPTPTWHDCSAPSCSYSPGSNF